jgi:hypothetical protein
MSRGRHHTLRLRGTDPLSAQPAARTPLLGLSKFAPPSTSRSSVHSRGPRCTHLRSHRPGVATTRLVPSLPFLPTSTVFSALAPQACCIPQPTMGFAVFQPDLPLSGIRLPPSWVRRPADPGVGAPCAFRRSPPKVGPQPLPESVRQRRRLKQPGPGTRLPHPPRSLGASRPPRSLLLTALTPFEGFPSCAALHLTSLPKQRRPAPCPLAVTRSSSPAAALPEGCAHRGFRLPSPTSRSCSTHESVAPDRLATATRPILPWASDLHHLRHLAGIHERAHGSEPSPSRSARASEESPRRPRGAAEVWFVQFKEPSEEVSPA